MLESNFKERLIKDHNRREEILSEITMESTWEELQAAFRKIELEYPYPTCLSFKQYDELFSQENSEDEGQY